MKKNIKHLFIFFFFLFISTRLFCQVALEEKTDPYEKLFFYAQTLENAGAYEQAEVEYKRYLFMQNYAEGQYQAQALYALAGLYEKKENWSLAAESMEKSLLYKDEEAARLLHIKYLFYEKNQANSFLNDDLYIFSYMMLPDFSDAIKIQAYSAVISNALANGRFEYAGKTFMQGLELFPNAWSQEEQTIMLEGFKKLSAFKPKNQKVAAYLSFLPGLGQLYAKDYKDSLNAFLLNGSLIALSVWSICSMDLWTFSLLEFNTLFRFMQGNIYNAQKDTYQYNQKKQTEITKPMLDALKID